MGMLGAETPAAGLPEGTFFDPMSRAVLVAPKTVRELELVPLASLAKYSVTLWIVFSFLHIRWTLCCKDAWDPIITGWKKESRGGGGVSGKKVLLEASADGTRGKASFHSEQLSLCMIFLLV